jgi:hypothetical protein
MAFLCISCQFAKNATLVPHIHAKIGYTQDAKNVWLTTLQQARAWLFSFCTMGGIELVVFYWDVTVANLASF